MTLHVTIHHKIIQKYLHKIFQILSEYFGHSPFICWRYIFNSKQHHLPYKSPLIYNKCNLVFVFWSYLEYPSKKEYASYHAIVFNISSVKGNGYGSFFVVIFRFLKSIQIFNLPFFLGTITMVDNHVVFSTNSMNQAANNLFIFCLIVAT